METAQKIIAPISGDEQMEEFAKSSVTNIALVGNDWLYNGVPDCFTVCEKLKLSKNEFPFNYDMRHWYDRKAFIKLFSFALPCRGAIEAIKVQSPLIEVGCGSGYWAKLLQNAGADIVPTGWSDGHYKWEMSFTEIEQIKAVDAVLKYPDRNVFMCWPNYDEDWAAEVAEENKNKLLYIGENGGCTANDRFFEILESSYDLIRTVMLPQFEGIHDNLYIYDHKE